MNAAFPGSGAARYLRQERAATDLLAKRSLVRAARAGVAGRSGKQEPQEKQEQPELARVVGCIRSGRSRKGSLPRASTSRIRSHLALYTSSCVFHLHHHSYETANLETSDPPRRLEASRAARPMRCPRPRATGCSEP